MIFPIDSVEHKNSSDSADCKERPPAPVSWGLDPEKHSMSLLQERISMS